MDKIELTLLKYFSSFVPERNAIDQNVDDSHGNLAGLGLERHPYRWILS
jgi:hypothetical protein